MTIFQGQTLKKGHCPKCHQPGKWKHVSKINTGRPIKYYKCTNPKCKFVWSETA